MTLVLTAIPQLVARERRTGNGATTWAWEIPDADQAALREAMEIGHAASYQKRVSGGAFVLLAWDPRAVVPRKAKPKVAAVQRAAGAVVRIYKPPARWTAGRTVVPYSGEPAAWGVQ